MFFRGRQIAGPCGFYEKVVRILRDAEDGIPYNTRGMVGSYFAGGRWSPLQILFSENAQRFLP